MNKDRSGSADQARRANAGNSRKEMSVNDEGGKIAQMNAGDDGAHNRGHHNRGKGAKCVMPDDHLKREESTGYRCIK